MSWNEPVPHQPLRYTRMLNVKMPLLYDTLALPPCASAIARTMDSPMPEPPVDELRDESGR